MNDTVHFEKTLSSETLFEGRVITLTKDTALLENGKTATREVVHHHGGACILPYFADGTICMVRQFRYAMQQQLWELPAGKLEKGEDPFEAAKRELEEECGLTADNYISLGEFYPTVGYDTEVIYTWVATGLHKTQMHLDDDEFLTPDRIPLAKAYEMVMRNEIKDGNTALQSTLQQNDSLEAHIAELEEQLATAEEDKKALDETVGVQSNQLRALDWLLEIENAYNTGDLDAAKDNIRSFEETGTVEFLPKEPLRTGITGADAPSPSARYQSIVDKLFPDGVK